MTDFSRVPLFALSVATRTIISTYLDPPKVIPSENGLPRDWRGLAHLSGCGGEIMPMLTSSPNPTARILRLLEEKSRNNTINDFKAILETIERWDIIDDAEKFFEEDARKYLEGSTESQESVNDPTDDVDSKVLTVDDLHRFDQGLQNQRYDAFLLYATEDVGFANDMVENLEKKYNLKLCLKDRDLVGGLTFEHEAIMTLISERCNRLIVIISPHFLKSPANKFFLNYAQALSIDKRQRKIIPCLYEKCELPPQLSYMFIMDYSRVALYDFWGRLRDSVRVSAPVKNVERYCNPLNFFKYSNRLEHCDEQADTSTTAIVYRKLLPIESVPMLAGTDEAGREENNMEDFNANGISSVSTLDKPHELKDRSSIVSQSISDLTDLKDKRKKSVNILQWTWKKVTKVKEDYSTISESISINNLPSTRSLDALDVTVHQESEQKKQTKRSISNYMKKIKPKKVLVNT